MEDNDPDFAMSLVKEAIGIYEQDDKIIYATQTFKYGISLTLQNKKLVVIIYYDLNFTSVDSMRRYGL